MALKILLNGCNGRMGREISQLVEEDESCEIVAGIDINNKKHFSFPVFNSPEKCDIPFDVIIDFSVPQALPAIFEYARSKKKGIVIATTGLEQKHKEMYEEISAIVPVFVSANMSLGINVLLSLAKKASAVLGEDFDIEIVESHHNKKIDAPSGTALMIADKINESAGNKYDYRFDRHILNEPRKPNEIGIHAIRGGSIVGEHTVLFAGELETVEITHKAKSRSVFGLGGVAAAKFIADKKPGLYSMEDLVGN